jgi:hypothetical protein
LINLTHPTGADFFDDAIVAERLANHKGDFSGRVS